MPDNDSVYIVMLITKQCNAIMHSYFRSYIQYVGGIQMRIEGCPIAESDRAKATIFPTLNSPGVHLLIY